VGLVRFLFNRPAHQNVAAVLKLLRRNRMDFLSTQRHIAGAGGFVTPLSVCPRVRDTRACPILGADPPCISGRFPGARPYPRGFDGHVAVPLAHCQMPARAKTRPGELDIRRGRQRGDLQDYKTERDGYFDPPLSLPTSFS